MALTMLDKKAAQEDRSDGRPSSRPSSSAKAASPTAAWAASFCRRPTRSGSGSSGSRRASGSASTATCSNYFWTSVNGGRGRQHLMDGTTVEYTYSPGETRHETYGPGEYKVHDLENLGDKEMIFNTIEFLDSANKPLPVPDSVRLAAVADANRARANPLAARTD